MKSLDYWSNVNPSLRFLKELLKSNPGNEIEKLLSQRLDRESKYKNWYIAFFDSILNDVDVLNSNQQTKDEIVKWIHDA